MYNQQMGRRHRTVRLARRKRRTSKKGTGSRRASKASRKGAVRSYRNTRRRRRTRKQRRMSNLRGGTRPMYSLIASEDPEEKYKGIIQAGNIVNGRVIIISCVLTRVKMLRQKARSYDIGIRVSTDRVPGNAAGVAGALEIFMHSADDDEICIPMNQNIGIKMWSPMRQAFGGLNENKINLNAMRGARLQEVSFVPKDRDGFVEFLGFLRAVQDDLTGRQSKLTDMMKPAEHLKVKTS